MNQSTLKSHHYLSILYLILALLGGVFPTLANIQFVKTYGPSFDLEMFIGLANSNPAAQSISRDLLFGATAITIWIITESRRLRMKNLWIVLLSSFTIAFAFAAPLFLFLRERRIIELINNEEKVYPSN